ncbi:MAG: hypothetical protein L0312_02550, partial [Acidobacteria bacterium]|nr:hypothetical protein [Acidobacteriota bacterium]
MKPKTHERLLGRLILLGLLAAFAVGAAAQTVTAIIPLPTSQFPRRPAIDQARKRVYVLVNHAFVPSIVFVIDTDTNAITHTIPVGTFVAGGAFNPANSKFYVGV